MQELNLFEIFTDRLNKSKISYVITGSVASIVYGEPRLTHDVDLVMEIDENEIDKLISIFPKEEFYIPPKEIIKTEVKRNIRGHFNIIHNETGFKADIYLSGNDKLQKYALEHKNYIKFGKSEISLAPVEYVILKKIEFYIEGKSEKHLIDIKNIMNNSPELIDNKIIEKFANTEVHKLWKIILEK